MGFILNTVTFASFELNAFLRVLLRSSVIFELCNKSRDIVPALVSTRECLYELISSFAQSVYIFFFLRAFLMRLTITYDQFCFWKALFF